MTVAVLSLGSNLGDRNGNLDRMRRLLAAVLLPPVRYSRLMETEPVGVPDHQQRYHNQVVCGGYLGEAGELLACCQRIESDLGRTRPYRWAARTADIDILLFGETVIDRPGIQVPHPRLLDRRYCLEGLMDLLPAMVLPGSQRTVAECYGAMPVEVRAQTVNFLDWQENP